MKNTWFFMIIVVLVVGYTIYQGQTEKNLEVDQKPQAGFQSPYFELEQLHGAEKIQLADLQKPVMINFWASWCGPCRMEAPDFAEVYEKYQDEVEFYAINITNKDKLESVESFVEEFTFTFPILLDHDGAVSERYQIFSIPTTFFVNTDGIIEHRVNGIISRAELELQLKNLVGR